MIPHSPPEEKKCSSSSVEVEEKGGRVEDVPLGVDPLSVGERVEDTSRGEGEGGEAKKEKMRGQTSGDRVSTAMRVNSSSKKDPRVIGRGFERDCGSEQSPRI